MNDQIKTIIKDFENLPQEIYELEIQMIALAKGIENIKKSFKDIETIEMKTITEVIGPTGKPLYSNEEKRLIALKEKLSTISVYNEMVADHEQKSIKLENLKAERDLKSRRFRVMETILNRGDYNG